MSRLTRALRSLTRRIDAGGPAPEPIAVPDPANHADRAVALFVALDRSFPAPGVAAVHREEVPAGGPCHLWPWSRLAAATLDLVALGAVPPSAADQLLSAGLDRYRRPGAAPAGYDSSVVAPIGPGGDRYYDDNAWVGLDLVRQHLLTGSAEALERADEVFAFLVSGWDGDPDRPRTGGVRWVESAANLDRNTVSTATAAALGFELHDLLGGDREREWAERMLGWVHVTLRDPSDGLYWDHVDARGTIERTKWSYNQGNVIGAELAAGRADRTDELGVGAAHLARAAAVATASLDLYERARDGLRSQGLPFNAIYFRNLVELRAAQAEAAPGDASAAALGERVVRALERVADEAWTRDRGPDGLVRPGAGARVATLIDQAAAVELEAVCALALDQRPSGEVAS